MKKSKFAISCQECIKMKGPCCEVHKILFGLMKSLDKTDRENGKNSRYRAFEKALSRTGESGGAA